MVEKKIIPKTKTNPKGAGRKPGTKNKLTLLTDEQRKQLADQNDGITPLQFFLSLLRDKETPMSFKIDAAKAAAPYLHRKMPIAIEGGDPRKPLLVLQQEHMSKLSKEELSMLYVILAKLDGEQ